MQWKSPKKSDILIYDACGAGNLAQYATGYSSEILPVRGECINLRCLLGAVLHRSFWTGSPVHAYTDAYLRVVSPKVVLTFIDNNPDFYSISKRFPDIKTVFVQNGTRGEVGDIFGRLVQSDRYHVDYMLVHGGAIGRQYRNYVSGEVWAIGSISNNEVPRCIDDPGRGILFISQYQDRPPGNLPLWIEPDGVPISWEQFFYSDHLVLQFLGKWCAENNKTLRICARGAELNCPEHDFFSEALADFEWEYVPRIDSGSSYKEVDSAEIVVFVDSTLGYESIGRGKKTAGFSCRILKGERTSYDFGWPAGLPDKGLFWTNYADENDFRRVMDYLSTASDEEWRRAREQHASDVMGYDAGNTRFRALLARLTNCAPRSNVMK